MFEKHTLKGWQPISEAQIRKKLNSGLNGVETTLAMIKLSGKYGYDIAQIGKRYRWVSMPDIRVRRCC
jgi:hypothetical protein